MSQWQKYNEKFVASSEREKYLIIILGIVAIVFLSYRFIIEPTMAQKDKLQEQVVTVKNTNKNNVVLINTLKNSLTNDYNSSLNKELKENKLKLTLLEEQFLALTTNLIDPYQMGDALIKLLKIEKGVKLLSFQVLPVQPFEQEFSEKLDPNSVNTQNVSNINKSNQNSGDITLYQHGIKLKIQGRYFQLSQYLQKLEALPWKFFWKKFDYQLKEYPLGELEIEIYSLSTVKEFVSV